MTAADFDKTVGHFYRAKPFQAFTIIMNDGQAHEVETRNSIIFRGGIASCHTEDADIVFIDSEHVKEIRPMAVEKVQ